MEAASEMLQAKFQKAESDLIHLTRKLELRCQDQAAGDDRRNPLELLRKVKAVKDEYKLVVQESAEIQRAQAEAMDYFRSELPIAMQALQQLQQQVGMGGSEADKAKLEELGTMLGMQVACAVAPPTTAVADSNQQSGQMAGEGTQPASSSAQEAESLGAEGEDKQPGSSVDEVVEDPVQSRAELRADSQECVLLSQEELESVSELIRGRVKLGDVNSVYRSLFKHFKEESNSQALSSAEMHKMGMRVSGATGQAKLKVLRALKLLTISSKGDVKLM